MWTFIIILVVLFFGKFIVDSLKQSNEIKNQGDLIMLTQEDMKRSQAKVGGFNGNTVFNSC